MTRATSASAQHRLFAAIVAYFRRYGHSPSHGDLEAATGIRKRAIGTRLRHMAAARMITLRLNVSHGIGLVSRAAELTDDEIVVEAMLRGWTVIDGEGGVHRPASAAALPLIQAMDHVESVPDWGLSALNELKHIE